MADIGHNGANERLHSFIQRAERMEDEIANAKLDLKEIFAEAKGEGFDVKALKRLIALRKKDKEKLSEENAMLRMYGEAIGFDVFG